MTLIEYRKNVYGVAGQASGEGAGQFLKSIDATARSFRALRASERSSLEESRLRARSAQSGETAAGVAVRTGSTWSAEALAVANGIEMGTALQEGRSLKVAIPQAYTPRGS